MVSEDAGAAIWRLLDYSRNSAFENLAVEEALARRASLRNFTQTIRLWVNPPSVVLGRFQTASTEVDVSRCEHENIQIARRFTGGGAVFQDEGNLNFTIVTRPELGTDRSKLSENSAAIILDALRTLGLNGSILPPNSILVGGKKVSGAAGALGKDFALWHSSILVSTDINRLESVLAPSREANATRYVHSRWHSVTNIQDALGNSVSLNVVKSNLLASVQEILGIKLQGGHLDATEENSFGDLYSRKYSLQDWNRMGR